MSLYIGITIDEIDEKWNETNTKTSLKIKTIAKKNKVSRHVFVFQHRYIHSKCDMLNKTCKIGSLEIISLKLLIFRLYNENNRCVVKV